VQALVSGTLAVAHFHVLNAEDAGLLIAAMAFRHVARSRAIPD